MLQIHIPVQPSQSWKKYYFHSIFFFTSFIHKFCWHAPPLTVWVAVVQYVCREWMLRRPAPPQSGLLRVGPGWVLPPRSVFRAGLSRVSGGTTPPPSLCADLHPPPSPPFFFRRLPIRFIFFSRRPFTFADRRSGTKLVGAGRGGQRVRTATDP